MNGEGFSTGMQSSKTLLSASVTVGNRVLLDQMV